MTSSRFLDYEVALLLAKYGKDPFLAALARRIHLTQSELETLLEAVPEQKVASRANRKRPGLDVVEEIIQSNPERAQFLQTLFRRFQNRTFLPELRDVRRFFDERSRNLRSPKSRTDALPHLMRLLAELDRVELETLCQPQSDGAYSSLGIISDSILRRDKQTKVGS